MQLKLIFTLYKGRAASSYLRTKTTEILDSWSRGFSSLFLFFGMEWNGMSKEEFFYERKRLYTRHRVNSRRPQFVECVAFACIESAVKSLSLSTSW